MKSDISSESFKRNLGFIRFVNRCLVNFVACSKEVRENYRKMAFELRNKETQIKNQPCVSANRSSMNCAQVYLTF